mgnify:CR=1 FL=1
MMRDNMENPFDPTAKLETKLRDDCFKIVSMVAMVAENPGMNAHFLDSCVALIEEMEEYLGEAGVRGDGREPPESQRLDAVDMLFLKTAEGLKNYFRKGLEMDDETNGNDE